MRNGRLPGPLSVVQPADPTFDLLTVWLDFCEAFRNVKQLKADLEKREGARSVTIMLLARESGKLATLARLLQDANLGDIIDSNLKEAL